MKTTDTPWRTDAPPQDGTVIVALGSIIEEWDGEIDVNPFTESIYWADWGWATRDGMALARFVEGTVTIHHWLPEPAQA